MADPDVIIIPAGMFWTALGVVGLGVGRLIWYIVTERPIDKRARRQSKDMAHMLPRVRAALERREGIPSVIPPADKPRKKMKTLTAIDKVDREDEMIDSLLRRYVDASETGPISVEHIGFFEDHDDEEFNQKRETEPPPGRRRR